LAIVVATPLATVQPTAESNQMLKSSFDVTAVGVGLAPRRTDAMSEPMNVRDLLAEAERAASTGDLGSAEELLRDAAQRQQAELGPFHPDLANTLNNLAVITEKAGRLHEAETFYRRAVEIASASLPAGDPMVAASRQNLEEFCRANGLPIEKPAVIEPARAATPVPPTRAAVQKSSAAVTPKASRMPAAIAVGVVGLLIGGLLIARPRSAHRESTQAPSAEPTPATAAEPARQTPKAFAPVDRTPSLARAVDRAPAHVGLGLATVQLCRSFSASDWRCVPAGDSVAPGSVVLYTRVRSSRDGVVVHRWYRGDALRKSAQLRIAPNAAEGYRTYSQQIVDPGNWRVEVRNGAGDLLHEQRFAVR
jgi:hypothetical protein